MNAVRLAYLRGEGMEMAVAEGLLPSLKDVAKVLGLRRLAPVQTAPSRSRDAEGTVVLKCIRCGRTGLPHEMLADFDGKPYGSYEHEHCPV